MTPLVFQDRAHGGRELGAALAHTPLRDPLVLAIPNGGLETAVPVAQALHAELDVVLSRKLRAPDRTELAIGAINEAGDVNLNGHSHLVRQAGAAWLEQERRHQMEEIARRQALFRGIRPRARLRRRSVIVVDDGLATGSTMIAALRMLHDAGTHEVIAAVPVAAPRSLAAVRAICDRAVTLSEPEDFLAVGQWYRRFDQVDDGRAAQLLREAQRPARPAGSAHAADPPPTTAIIATAPATSATRPGSRG